MARKNFRPSAAWPAALLLTLVACEAQKSSNPLSPSVAGPIAGVEITAPVLVEPAQGLKYRESQQPIRLVIQNANSTGVRPITYTFEIATDTNFETKVFARASVPPGDGGRTAVQADRLDIGRAYYWRARAEDGANMSLYSTAQFEVLPKPDLSVPGLVSPVNNERVSSATPTLTVSNSTHNSAVGSLRYEFQVAKDAAFTLLSATGSVDEGGGQTSYQVDRTLDANLTHYWRARATDGDTTTSWSGAQTFRTPASGPDPGPGPGPGPGGTCNSSNPQAIVQCERAKYGHMSSSQTLNFLRAVAVSLGRNGISGGPFGILRKSGGSNCNGFSCDIICAGQGNGQKQWDVLGDAEGAQVPAWNGPITVPNIRIDVCEIQ